MMSEFWKNDSGQGLAEYTLIAALVSVALMAVMVVFRDSMGRVFAFVAELLDDAPETQYVG